MSRIYKYKLVVLLCVFLLPAALLAGNQWVSISSQSPSVATITSSALNSSSIEIAIDIPGFYFSELQSEGKTFKNPLLPQGYPMLQQGCPDLQKLSFTMQLPANGINTLSIVSSEFIEYTNIDIAPSAGDQVRTGTIGNQPEGLAYTTNAFFPGELYNAEQPYAVRNTRAQAIQVFPFQYNPVTRVLRVYYQLTLSADITTDKPGSYDSENNHDIKNIEGLGVTCINQPVSRLKSGQLPSDRGCMLIICPENFRAAIEPLVQWRKQTGIATEIVGSEQFADAEAIYTFVKSYYKSHANLAYLLLVGDAGQVPSYMLPYGASDNYYAYLAGNDHYPDILVGRFSAETPQEVEVQVTRTLQYEKQPGTDTRWLASATGIASTLTPGDDGEADFQHVGNLLKTLKSTSYNQYAEFFDGSQGDADADGNPATTDIMNKINLGTGVIFYTGHGSPNSWATGSVTKSVVENLSNIGRYPLIWSAACENGNFTDKYCFAEAWLRASASNGQPLGAVAALMASGSQTSYPPMQAQDVVAELLANPSEEISTMGAISVKGMMSMNDIYGAAGYATTDTWILFGDPSLRVRTSTPKQFSIQHSETIGRGRISFSFTSGSTGGFACLSQQGTIMGTTSVKEGKNILYLDLPVAGNEVTLTITALNYLPYVAQVQVTNTPATVLTSTPENHSRLQPINSSFAWENGEGADPEFYLFYLGTDNPPSNIINGQKLTSAQLKTQLNFHYDTKYYWKVVSVNAAERTESRVMDFTTVYSPDEDFEAAVKSKLTWDGSGMQSWQNDASQHFDGSRSLRSGQVGNNEYSSLVYQCQVSDCDFVGFWSKTSSEPNDKLQFMVDGVAAGEWGGITGWTYHSFKIDAGIHKLEWRYAKNADSQAGDDAAWLDNIHLPVHGQASATLAGNSSICENSDFQSVATASNYFGITWKTEGDGRFNDANLENIVYTPGTADVQKKQATLHMHLKSFEGCPEMDKIVSLDIHPLPVINLPADTIAANGSIELNAGSSDNFAYTWLPGGSNSPYVVIDSVSATGGTKTATVIVTSSEGCSSTKDIKIHFNNPSVEDTYSIYPNPSNGNFTITPAKGSAVIEQMQLVDRQGKVVWYSNQNLNIVGSEQISIPGLSGGAYMLVSQNSSGRSVNKLIIR
ncbi:MAG: C25 family cysteine peptidase [Bacteroidales bacterium]